MLLRDPLPDPGAGAGWRALSSRTASSRGKRESGLDGDGGNDALSASPRSEGSLWRPWGAQAGTAVPGSAAPAMPGALGPGPGGGKGAAPRAGAGRGVPMASRRQAAPAGPTAALPGLVPLSWGWPAQGCLSERRNFTLFTRFHKQGHQHSLVANYITFALITTQPPFAGRVSLFSISLRAGPAFHLSCRPF